VDIMVAVDTEDHMALAGYGFSLLLVEAAGAEEAAAVALEDSVAVASEAGAPAEIGNYPSPIS